MSVELGGFLALFGFVGSSLCMTGWNKSKSGSSFETLAAIGLLLSTGACVLMVFQGFHLWNQGWDSPLSQMDPGLAGRTAARSRGKGGTILLAIQFMPQFLVFGYAGLIWQMRDHIKVCAKHLGIISKSK